MTCKSPGPPHGGAERSLRWPRALSRRLHRLHPPLPRRPSLPPRRGPTPALDWNRHALDALGERDGRPDSRRRGHDRAGVGAPRGDGAGCRSLTPSTPIDGGHEPYLAGLPPASPAERRSEAAVATAAHHVLVGLGGGSGAAAAAGRSATGSTRSMPESLGRYPRRSGGDRRDRRRLPPPCSAMLDGGGTTAATCRSRTPVGAGPGEWRPTPPGFVNDPFALGGERRPVRAGQLVAVPDTADRSSRHQPTRYAKEYNEVKSLGTGRSPRSSPIRRPSPSSTTSTPMSCSTARCARHRRSGEGLTPRRSRPGCSRMLQHGRRRQLRSTAGTTRRYFQLLASDHRDPVKATTTATAEPSGTPTWTAARGHSAVPRSHVRATTALTGGDDAHGQGLLRLGTG